MKKGKDTLVSGRSTKAPKPSKKDQAKAAKIVKGLKLDPPGKGGSRPKG